MKAALASSPLLKLYETPGASTDISVRSPMVRRTIRWRTLGPAARPARRTRYTAAALPVAPTAPNPALYAVARAYDIDPEFLGSVVHVEAGANPAARSAKGALGLMQVMPATARRFGVASPETLQPGGQHGGRSGLSEDAAASVRQQLAEVAARFSLDAMPGKQLSIDSDLRSGLIDKDEARRRRKNLELESIRGGLGGEAGDEGARAAHPSRIGLQLGQGRSALNEEARHHLHRVAGVRRSGGLADLHLARRPLLDAGEVGEGLGRTRQGVRAADRAKTREAARPRDCPCVRHAGLRSRLQHKGRAGAPLSGETLAWR